MISAREAREIVEGVNSNKVSTQLKDIERVLNIAINNGKHQTCYYEYLIPSVEKQLKMLGYTVHTSDFRNEVTVTISW